MINCISCGINLPNEAKFCKECGTKQIKVCPSCKTPIEDATSKFCMECGYQVSTTSTIEKEPKLSVHRSGKLAVHGEYIYYCGGLNKIVYRRHLRLLTEDEAKLKYHGETYKYYLGEEFYEAEENIESFFIQDDKMFLYDNALRIISIEDGSELDKFDGWRRGDEYNEIGMWTDGERVCGKLYEQMNGLFSVNLDLTDEKMFIVSDGGIENAQGCVYGGLLYLNHVVYDELIITELDGSTKKRIGFLDNKDFCIIDGFMYFIHSEYNPKKEEWEYELWKMDTEKYEKEKIMSLPENCNCLARCGTELILHDNGYNSFFYNVNTGKKREGKGEGRYLSFKDDGRADCIITEDFVIVPSKHLDFYMIPVEIFYGDQDYKFHEYRSSNIKDLIFDSWRKQ